MMAEIHILLNVKILPVVQNLLIFQSVHSKVYIIKAIIRIAARRPCYFGENGGSI